ATVRDVLLYGCEIWPVRSLELRRLQDSENRFLRIKALVGYFRRIRDETIIRRTFGCTAEMSFVECV
ncbi:hypothetical protein CLF_103846, partial [Clonorchis sinensis]